MTTTSRQEVYYIPDNTEAVLDRPEWATYYRVIRSGRLDTEVVFSACPIDEYSEPIPDNKPGKYTKLVVLNEYDPVWNHLVSHIRWE